jgi:transcriptional regulator with XRE-family HTH domain
VSFGEHLRRLREGAGLSRAELARRAGFPASTLRNWEGDLGFSWPTSRPAAG